MIRKSVAIWMVVLAVSITLLVSGGIAMISAGIVADENNLTGNSSSSLWVVGVGLIGFVVSLPVFLGTVTTSRRSPGR